MKRLIAIACVCLGSVLLASRGKPVHSVDYYKQHEDERKAMLEKCTADPDLVTSDENCRGAADAQALSGSYTPSKPQEW
ncbi:EexN family lipoprotein [Paraburkholderia dilworthii]|uniref:EexN family lipoprotein n=1 Tax=Paraburkholderia dilworthii TaxID=948106 RepID=UPI0003FCBF73|nr:EexN family lipoprotein [Paraburkholderia dilworthii]